MRGRVAALVLAGLGLVTACSDSDADSPDGAGGFREASCELEGSASGQAALVEEDDAFTVTWDGFGVPSSDRFDYSVQLADEQGTRAQLLLVYQDGELAEHLVNVVGADFRQHDQETAPQVEGDRVTAVFARDDDALTDLEVTQWHAAAYSRDLSVGGACTPEDEPFLPFP
ncbi:hypothetical protein [Nocardioides campestrisoli]|uniref:hypothetical protein n=1 Tax=Nocardioides campestrisoli TaxID=2736757 RepID=UPI0015E6F7E0|nr:hypothetical protein [Nocardioides campestrisoli]